MMKKAKSFLGTTRMIGGKGKKAPNMSNKNRPVRYGDRVVSNHMQFKFPQHM